MYLIQDTSEAVYTHMARGFSPDPMLAYIEFWGVMQATDIQQDAPFFKSIKPLSETFHYSEGVGLGQASHTRHLCAGHPANRSYGVAAPQRTFIGRRFGNYDQIQYDLYDGQTDIMTHPTFNLWQMINDYGRGSRKRSIEYAGKVALAALGRRYPCVTLAVAGAMEIASVVEY